MGLSFDQLRQEAKTEYLDFVIEDGDKQYVLRSPLRLSSDERAKLEMLVSVMNEDDVDSEKKLDDVEIVDTIIVLVASTKATGTKVLSEFKDDVPAKMLLLRKYMETVGMGEASDLPN